MESAGPPGGLPAGETVAAGQPLARIAEWSAAFGGFCLLGVMAVELVSVTGGLFGRPLLGDSEIVEMLCGIAVACFLPWCQVRGGNVIVDFFTMRTSQHTRDVLDAVMSLAVAIVVAVITWRLVDGAFTQYERGRVSMFLRLPQWWGYGLAGLAALLWTACCIATCVHKTRAAFARGSAVK